MPFELSIFTLITLPTESGVDTPLESVSMSSVSGLKISYNCNLDWCAELKE